MTMRQRLARLFTIKTRTEALLVTYAIAAVFLVAIVIEVKQARTPVGMCDQLST